jgi:hypothetical protein
MRAWVLSAALSVALIATPLWAQRGGGGHGGGFGGHGGFGGARGYAGGAVVRGGMPGYGGYGYGRGPIFSAYPRGGWNGYGYGGRGRYPGRYPYGYNRYPWWGGYYAGWYPWWGWGGIGWYDYDDCSDYYDYNNCYNNNYPSNYAPTSYPSEVYLGAPSGGYAPNAYEQGEAQGEIQQLQSEVSQLQSQQENRSPGPELQEIHSNTILVYKDGRKQEVQNYAIVGKTLWIMNENKATKVPLSELNLPVTERDNEDRGIEFYVPSTQK